MRAEPSKEGDQFGHFYVWDQIWARSARVEVAVHAAAQPSENGSEGEQASAKPEPILSRA